MRFEFELNFVPEHFKEIYFRNRQGHYLLSPTTKQAATFMLIFGIILIVLLSISSFKVDNTLAVMATIAFVLSVLYYLGTAQRLWRWRRQVRAFLKKQSQYGQHRIVLTEDTFRVIQDDETHIERWSNIKTADISDTHIMMSGEQDLLIPMKALGREDFDILKKLISARIE